MAVEVVVPNPGAGARPAEITEWYKPDGADVQKGEPVYRYESDFVAIDVEAEADGVLRHRLDVADADHPGRVIGFILAPGEHMPDPRTVHDHLEASTESIESAVPLEEASERPPAEGDAGFTKAMEAWAHSSDDDRHAHGLVHKTPAEAAIDPVEPKPLPLLRRRRDDSPPVGIDKPWGSVPGDDQAFEDAWSPGKGGKKGEEGTDVFGYPRNRKPETADESAGTDVFGYPRRGESPHPSEQQAVEIPPFEEALDAAYGKPPSFDLEAMEPPVRLPSDPMPEDVVEESDADAETFEFQFEPERVPAADESRVPPIPFPVTEEDWRAQAALDGAAVAAPVILSLKLTVRMAETRKMRDQLTREWRTHEVVPLDEDIIVRSFARAIAECPGMRGHGDGVGLVLLDPEGESVAVLAGAAHGAFREQVKALAAARKDPAPGPCACTITTFAGLGIEEGTPPLPDGHALALAVGDTRPIDEEDSSVPVPYATFTLAYTPELISISQAAMVLARVKELLEAPYALLAD